MAEPAVTPTPTGAPNPEPKSPGVEPGKTPDVSDQFDPSKLSDADFDKLYSDDRLYKHPRFKSLSDRAKKADQYEKDQEKVEKERLEKEGKWQEAAALAEKGKDEAETRLKESTLKNALIVEASKLGVVDTDAAVLLVDRAGITIADDGTVTGAKEALAALVEAKPYLKGNPQQPVGSPSNPNPSQTEAGTKRFKLSQLQDHKFFMENQKDIEQALKLNLIEDDVN